MSDLLSELHDKVFVITLNRIDKHNAFDDTLLKTLQLTLDAAIANRDARVIMLRAHGKYFSAGADFGWMQRMAQFNEDENLADAMVLARLMQSLYQCPKPTIAVVQGGAFGGGVGLVAACDIAIAARTASFCFSEVKIGLIPAVISPYIVKAIGERAAKCLFMTAETFDAQRAQELQLVHHCVNEDELWPFARAYAQKITQLAPDAVVACKTLVMTVSGKPIDAKLMQETATLIAKKRVSREGQQGMHDFLNKKENTLGSQMFNKILIANRGEIACRVIKTAKKMGIETIAIYSTADKDSLHVNMASHAYWVGEAEVIASYLNIEAIIAVATAHGAEAIHPGYGFLSENPAFAKACDAARIVFIGPSVAAMEIMGSKQLAKQLLAISKVPLIPGYHGNEQADDCLFQEAERIGFPILLKAARGGGGKGMRAIHDKTMFFHALASARRESMASFADDTMIIEQLLVKPRHIEVQIMADNYGEVVHLFERDCSIQRRHQKIIEEAPAPNLNQDLRQKLNDAACLVARAIDYRGAGTVEFIVDNAGNFYFMEMNTRLQVEHPVTEMITGLDLVAWQIQIAAGEPLPCKQEEIVAHGHAIECRIYAEDPYQDFIPSVGQLHFLREPTGAGIRIDNGVTENSVISQYYDPMIAKLSAHGATRECARQGLQRALGQFAIGGVKTNIPFLQAICRHPRFSTADVSTDFLNQIVLTMPVPDKRLALLMAACYDYLALIDQEQEPIFIDSFGWQMHLATSWYWAYLLGDTHEEINIVPINHEQLQVSCAEIKITLKARYANQRLVVEDGQQVHSVWVENQANKLIIYFEDGLITVARFNWQRASQEIHYSAGHLMAPMPATVVAILKQRGELIRKDEPLIILEAMKMEHTIHAPKDGIITEIFYGIGQQVNEGAQLLTLGD